MSEKKKERTCPFCEKVYTKQHYYDSHVIKCEILQAKKKARRAATIKKVNELKPSQLTVAESMVKAGYKIEEESVKTIFKPKNPNEKESNDVDQKKGEEAKKYENSKEFEKLELESDKLSFFENCVLGYLGDIKKEIKINTSVKKRLGAQLDASLSVMRSFTEKIEAKEDRMFTQMGVMTTCMDLMMNSISLLELANNAPEVKIVKVPTETKEHADDCNCQDCQPEMWMGNPPVDEDVSFNDLISEGVDTADELIQGVAAKKSSFGKKAAFGKKQLAGFSTGLKRLQEQEAKPRAKDKPKSKVKSSSWDESEEKKATVIELTIKAVTAKAILIKAAGVEKEVWIPKSTIHGNQSFKRDSDAKLEIDDWILERNGVI